MRAPIESRPVSRWGAQGAPLWREDALAVEEPLEIRLNGERVMVTMRTPGADEDLALGLLHSEGILDSRAGSGARVLPVADVEPQARGNVLDVRAPASALRRGVSPRPFRATSACGICGAESLAAVAREFERVTSSLRVASGTLRALPVGMRANQPGFARTGGLHAAARFDAEGRLLAAREDVGRHNAVDKIVGAALAKGELPLAGSVLVVSGRAGFEVVQKAVAAGAPVLAAVGAPSSLAARLAEEAGLTLVGFLNAETFNVYSHPERIVE